MHPDLEIQSSIIPAWLNPIYLQERHALQAFLQGIDRILVYRPVFTVLGIFSIC
jgi:hypothetical protein